MRRFASIIACFALLILGSSACTTIAPRDAVDPATAASETTFSHALFDQVLMKYVDGAGRVDYTGLAGDSADLDAYYARLAAVSPDSHPALFPDPDARLAYWINAYNASVIVAVLRDYPIESVRDVRSPALFFLPRLAGFFYLQRVELGGRKINLYDLENGIIRKRFDEPRVHFALNCASLSCPRLPVRAFDAAHVEDQLEAETKRFVSEPRNVAIHPDDGTISLSAIFDWYETDFTHWVRDHRPADGAATLIDYVTPYLTAEQAEALGRCDACRVVFEEYDWGLNDQAAPLGDRPDAGGALGGRPASGAAAERRPAPGET